MDRNGKDAIDPADPMDDSLVQGVVGGGSNADNRDLEEEAEEGGPTRAPFDPPPPPTQCLLLLRLPAKFCLSVYGVESIVHL